MKNIFLLKTKPIMRRNKFILALSFCLAMGCLLGACTAIPKEAKSITGFDVNRYLGTWYEIARLDNRFEKDLDNAVAQYSLDAKGNVSVRNSGYNYITEEWKHVDGTAKFRGDKQVADLEVSFFGPFYSGYNVLALDSNYQYALVAGKNLDYLWILSREKDIPDSIKQAYLALAKSVGYATDKLLWVKQNRDNPYVDGK